MGKIFVHRVIVLPQNKVIAEHSPSYKRNQILTKIKKL
jgi:hypothetical protein